MKKNLQGSKSIYLDYNATTPVHSFIVDEIKEFFLSKFFNPSSYYADAKEVKVAIEDARQKVARFYGVKENDVIFTSGGTESNNTIIKGVFLDREFSNQNKGILISEIEHPSVYKSASYMRRLGEEVLKVRVLKNGKIDIDHAYTLIKKYRPKIVSIMACNNETGVIQPVEEIAKICSEEGVLFHSDCVCATGKMEVRFEKTEYSFISASSHKIYAPKGCGVVVKNEKLLFPRLISGGSQERNNRGGTENAPAIIGTGMAYSWLSENMEALNKKMSELRKNLERGLKQIFSDIVIFGETSSRISNTTLFYVPYLPKETLLINLDLLGIKVSGGSACSSGALKPSPVLLAMGYSEKVASNAIRVSIGKNTTEEDVAYFLNAIADIGKKLKQLNKGNSIFTS